MKTEPFLPFALPDIGEEEINEVVQTLRSGWVTTGPKTKQFESEFTEYLKSGADHLLGPHVFAGNLEAIAVNSATAGLHLALEAIGLKEGDEVITTAYTFTATAEVVRYFNAHPVLVDIDPNTFNIDSSKIEEKITTKTKAIIPVHFAGLVCDMDPIIKLAKKYNLKVIEDAAHTLPSFYHGQMIGTFETDFTVFSFYATKTITTGEGGMVVTKNPEYAKRCRVMRLHGINRDAFDRYTSKAPSWYYEVVAPGFKYNMTDVASSIGIQQLKKANAFQKKRQQMAEYYMQQLSDLPITNPPMGLTDSSNQLVAGAQLHSWHLFVIQLGKEIQISREEFIQKMSDLGVGCSVHFIPLHLHPVWKTMYNYQPNDFPNTMKVFERAVSLPLYTKMTQANQDRVVECIRKIVREST